MNLTIEYTLVRSKRKTIGIEIERDGSVVVRAPFFCSKARIDAFIWEKEDWILKTKKKILSRQTKASDNGFAGDAFSSLEIERIKKLAKATIIPMVEEIAKEMGATYNGVSLRFQKTRWGSCSGKGNLNFNCLLVLMPPSVVRYVVVHELAHRFEMNHSKAFWEIVARYQPSYKEDRKYLKENGGALMERLDEA